MSEAQTRDDEAWRTMPFSTDGAIGDHRPEYKNKHSWTGPNIGFDRQALVIQPDGSKAEVTYRKHYKDESTLLGWCLVEYKDGSCSWVASTLLEHATNR